MNSAAESAAGSRGSASQSAWIALAVVSAISFSLSGTLGAGLFETGWSPGAVVLVRTVMGTVIAAPFGIRAMRGRWHLVRTNLRPLLAFGLAGVALSQFAYLSAVQTLDVGVAILIEYSSPIVVVLWLWLHSRQRPTRLTALGSVVAPIGLLLVIDVFGGAAPDIGGVGWALLAMCGAVVYYITAGDATVSLPPVALASGGLVVGTAALGILGVAGIMPVVTSAADPSFAGRQVPLWVVLGALGVVTEGVAYLTSVIAARRLGARLTAFVGLVEVLSANLIAWALLGQQPSGIQASGAVIVLAGVILVQAGERQAVTVRDNDVVPPGDHDDAAGPIA